MFGLDDALIAIKIISALKDLIYDKVIEAEQDPQLPTGKTKHKSVEVQADRFIDDEVKKYNVHPSAAGEIKRDVSESIEKAVKTMNQKGMFANG